MADQKQMDPLADDAPYSLDNFLWLLDNSSAKTYLSEESLKEVDEALKKNNDGPLKDLYPIILEQFVRERDININFALAQESLMHDFITNVEDTGLKVKKDLKARTEKVEAKERAKAENILEKLDE